LKKTQPEGFFIIFKKYQNTEKYRSVFGIFMALPTDTDFGIFGNSSGEQQEISCFGFS
jgi:hypothetical protein